MKNWKVKVKAYGKKAPFDRELEVRGGDFQTAAHRAVVKFFSEKLNKDRKRNVNCIVIKIEKA